MALSSPTAVTVLTAAILLSGAETGSSSGHTAIVQPAGTIYVGGSDVTTSTGIAITTGVAMSFRLEAGEALYGISAGSVVTAVLHLGV